MRGHRMNKLDKKQRFTYNINIGNMLLNISLHKKGDAAARSNRNALLRLIWARRHVLPPLLMIGNIL